MDDNVFLWLARLAIYGVFLSLAFWAGQVAARRSLRGKLPAHNHAVVEGCDRCKFDRMLEN